MCCVSVRSVPVQSSQVLSSAFHSSIMYYSMLRQRSHYVILCHVKLCPIVLSVNHAVVRCNPQGGASPFSCRTLDLVREQPPKSQFRNAPEKPLHETGRTRAAYVPNIWETFGKPWRRSDNIFQHAVFKNLVGVNRGMTTMFQTATHFPKTSSPSPTIHTLELVDFNTVTT